MIWDEQRRTALLSENHSGMETRYQRGQQRAFQELSENHSGMETLFLPH